MARVALANQRVSAHATVTAAGVYKSYRLDGEPLPVLEDVSFEIGSGEFVSFVGPSGSGKSTLLNLLAGLEEPDRGRITISGSTDRLGHAAYMPQKDLLLPWRSALDNAVLGMEVHGVPREDARHRAREMFEIAGLAGFERSLPAALSGGMRQRVAFLRTVLTPGSVMLLDEPFGALDSLTRSELQEWLMRMWERLSTTVVLVTHDVEEALLLSDRVYVMTRRPGRIKLVHEVGLPRPRSLEVLDSEEFVRSKSALLRAVRGEV